MARRKRWTVMPLYHKMGGIYLILRERKTTRKKTEARLSVALHRRGATAGDERLKALTPAISTRGIVYCAARLRGCCSMVDFQAINHCSDAGHRGHGRQGFFYLVRGR